jgi:uncharacterized protein DUF6186
MSASRAITIVAFLAALVMAAVLEWRARRPDAADPTLAEVCAYVLGYRVGRLPVGRIAVLGFWWWVGWHFLAR